jgi:hypothetical protein
LTGCATNKLQTFVGGSCKAFPRPDYQVKGRTKYDQTWVDKVTEAGVAGCQWERPKPRPASWDATVVVPSTITTPEVVTVKKPGFISRTINRFRQ